MCVNESYLPLYQVSLYVMLHAPSLQFCTVSVELFHMIIFEVRRLYEYILHWSLYQQLSQGLFFWESKIRGLLEDVVQLYVFSYELPSTHIVHNYETYFTE